LEEKIQFKIRKKGSVILIVFLSWEKGKKRKCCESQSMGGFEKISFGIPLEEERKLCWKKQGRRRQEKIL
jgi:hypothetical protein